VQCHNRKIANRYFETVAQLKCLRKSVTNQNFIKEKIKRRLNIGNTYYHSVQNLLFSHLLSKNAKIRIYKTIMSHVVLYGCKKWHPTLRVKAGGKA
jgi:hypothetical protein